MDTEQDKLESKLLARDENGRLLPGQPSLNPAGRPKGKTLKEFARDWYMNMSAEEKAEYIKKVEEKKPGFAWTMAEGSPAAHTDITTNGESLQPVLVKFIDGNQDNRDTEGV